MRTIVLLIVSSVETFKLDLSLIVFEGMYLKR